MWWRSTINFKHISKWVNFAPTYQLLRTTSKGQIKSEWIYEDIELLWCAITLDTLVKVAYSQKVFHLGRFLNKMCQITTQNFFNFCWKVEDSALAHFSDHVPTHVRKNKYFALPPSKIMHVRFLKTTYPLKKQKTFFQKAYLPEFLRRFHLWDARIVRNLKT